MYALSPVTSLFITLRISRIIIIPCIFQSIPFQTFQVHSCCNGNIYRVAHEKSVRRLVEQRGRRSRALYGKLNKCKYKVLTG